MTDLLSRRRALLTLGGGVRVAITESGAKFLREHGRGA